ncbi:hypothetical protein IGI87_000074 [Enterococcus sp. DIV1444a]
MDHNRILSDKVYGVQKDKINTKLEGTDKIVIDDI